MRPRPSAHLADKGDTVLVRPAELNLLFPAFLDLLDAGAAAGVCRHQQQHTVDARVPRVLVA